MSKVRFQGAGGRNVNQVATPIHLPFDIVASSLPDSPIGKRYAIDRYKVSKEISG